jgi:hypothetical protein
MIIVVQDLLCQHVIFLLLVLVYFILQCANIAHVRGTRRGAVDSHVEVVTGQIGYKDTILML